MAEANRPAAWELRDVTKRFPGVLANDAINLVLRAGEIHGLMGENGCGKSTIIKSLMGVHEPDEGAILKDGIAVTISNPTSAREAGIAAVFQEFSLVPTLSVGENIYLGRMPKRGGRIDWAAMRRGAKAALEQLRVDLDPDAIVGDLSVAEQQLVEIAKATAAQATLFILDEPTTALGIDEISELHRVVKGLKTQGAGILYVSHRLDEVVNLVDCVTVLKDGRVVSNAQETPVSVEAIIRAMIGDVSEHYPKEANSSERTLLEVDGIQTENRVRGATFSVNLGEVFGLGGVLGSGRTEIARAIFGVDPLTAGEIRIDGTPVGLRSPSDAVAAGIALVPENRKFDGLFFNFPGLQNISVAKLERLERQAWILALGHEKALCRDLIDKLEITPAAEERLVGLLSGGNQQKIVIARWLFAEANIFLLDEPTQGIDVGAKIAVYRLINELTSAGKAVVLISSDHDELLAMSDRIGIVSHGKLVDVRPAAEVSKDDLVRASTEEEVEQ